LGDGLLYEFVDDAGDHPPIMACGGKLAMIALPRSPASLSASGSRNRAYVRSLSMAR
jgi:hypothetical protein